ncbi:MAG: replication factor C small subunit [Candidatus Diapherotrites archaeon CG08_land_8_20_14_0_20_30_16]|nr:MAG: replication factor C small subunit [Candidatus Diapherotrites archaeon CG08_land_8_20_14_0_20_30_16]
MTHKDANLPWVEKYRPDSLNDVVGNELVVKRLKKYTEDKDLPNMIFAGPAGTGKTTSAIAISKQLFKENAERNFLELNASVTPDTPILIKEGKEIHRVNFGWLAEKYFLDFVSKRVCIDDLEVLSLDKCNNVKFMKVGHLFRHKVNEILKIKYEGGEVKTSLSHSIMVFDDCGNIITKKASEIKKGDLLISFKTDFEGQSNYIDLEKYKSAEFCQLRSGIQPNPTFKKNFDTLSIDDDLSWYFGMYLAEGCTSMSNTGTSGQIIYTLGYPNPKDVPHIENIQKISTSLGLNYSCYLGASGFDRTKKTSLQTRVFNTQLAKFMQANFYGGDISHKANTKRVPTFIFDTNSKQRLSFIKGYWDGDGSGIWEKVARISSVSQECLIDVVWLSRLSNVESSVFPKETRLIWPNKSFSYTKAELLPSKIFNKLAEKYKGKTKYLLRHSLYSKMCDRISKTAAEKVLALLKNKKGLEKLNKLVNSDLYVLAVTEIKKEKHNDYVYDVSVPGAEVFWGGTAPVLLHNSDDRGIDVVRKTIKDFARTLPLEAEYKIIFLDEADALTQDAQQALRRTMEKYTRTCRFILSCNYSSRIIEPIQSRCVVFRFKPLEKESVINRLEEVSKNEKLKIDNKALSAIFYVSLGDMRKAINILQACSVLDDSIGEQEVFTVSARARPEEVKKMVLLAKDGKFKDARDLLYKLMFNYGMSGEDILNQIYREVVDFSEDYLNSREKVSLIEIISEINFRVSEGANDRLQIEAMLAMFNLHTKQ